MVKISPLSIAPPLIFAALAGLFIFGMGRDDANQLPSAQTGKDAPSLVALVPLAELPTIDDDMLRDGQVKLVNFWASWCAPCRAEHAQLETLHETGTPILGVNYKDDATKALAFMEELGNPYTVIGADETGRTALEWGVYGVPETYVVDGNGKITYRFAGPITIEVLDRFILPEIAKASAQ